MGASNHHGLGSGGTNACSPYAQLPNRPPAFRVRVYNDGLFKSLLDDGRTSATSPRSLGRSAKSRPSRPPQEDRSEAMLKAGALAKKKRREKQYLFQLTQQQLLQDRLVRDKLLEAAASKEREFVRLSGEVEAGRTFVKELDRILGIADEAQQGKTLKQYQEWDANVHGAIQVQMWSRTQNVLVVSRHLSWAHQYTTFGLCSTQQLVSRKRNSSHRGLEMYMISGQVAAATGSSRSISSISISSSTTMRLFNPPWGSDDETRRCLLRSMHCTGLVWKMKSRTTCQEE
ncbi:unnamed protein product [Ectocarpus sp. 13 AM-2016]